MVPNISWKINSGWTNHSETVTSYNMSENEMGNRVSKSSFSLLEIGVKEQRVDGSWCFKICASWPSKVRRKHLRYTLMGLERGYLVEVPSKLFNNLCFSTFYSSAKQLPLQGPNAKDLLNPWFVTGFTDAEGSFTVTIYPENRMRSGIKVIAIFKIGLNERDLELLHKIKYFFGMIGSITYNASNNTFTYAVTNLKDLLNVIIPHFWNYPLLSQKSADFNIFCIIVKLLNDRIHLSETGLEQIVNLKASLNKGSSEFVKSRFTNIKPVNKDLIESFIIPSGHWISGFTSGEGNFDAGIRKATDSRKERVYLRFRITQHNKDRLLMELIIKTLGVGRIEVDNRKDHPTVNIIVGNFSEIYNKIIPFFDQYPIFGAKYLDYKDWVKITDLIRVGRHLTSDGMEQIKLIEKGMNKGRKKD
jgi:hypothetical protein